MLYMPFFARKPSIVYDWIWKGINSKTKTSPYNNSMNGWKNCLMSMGHTPEQVKNHF